MSKKGGNTGYSYSFPLGSVGSPTERTRLYYECHVTIDPVFDERLEEAGRLAKSYGFRIASLLMQKRKDDTPERSKYDTFMTAHDKQFGPLMDRARQLAGALILAGFRVHRVKIEDTVFDTKHGDAL